jgi:hypothetical protein
MFMIDYKDIGWWYWLATGSLLIGGLTGQPSLFILAIFLTVFHFLHYFVRERSIAAFPVQIRIAILLLLLVSYPEPMRPLYWAPTIGAVARIFFGYCLMARFISLMPWNRDESFSFALIRKTFLSAPTKGNIRQGLPATEDSQ